MKPQRERKTQRERARGEKARYTEKDSGRHK